MYRLIKALFCTHEWEWVCNFYGDAMRAHGNKGSRWVCPKCTWIQFRDERHEKPKPTMLGKTFRIEEPNGPF